MTLDIRWKQRFDNFQRALHQLTLAMELKAQRPLSELERKRPATTILTVKAGLVQRLPVLSFQRCGSSSSTRLAG